MMIQTTTSRKTSTPAALPELFGLPRLGPGIQQYIRGHDDERNRDFSPSIELPIAPFIGQLTTTDHPAELLYSLCACYRTTPHEVRIAMRISLERNDVIGIRISAMNHTALDKWERYAKHRKQFQSKMFGIASRTRV
jgi:hypothetical protein